MIVILELVDEIKARTRLASRFMSIMYDEGIDEQSLEGMRYYMSDLEDLVERTRLAFVASCGKSNE